MLLGWPIPSTAVQHHVICDSELNLYQCIGVHLYFYLQMTSPIELAKPEMNAIGITKNLPLVKIQ